MKSRQPLVALATCREVPDLVEDDQELLKALAQRGIRARAEVWSNRAAIWSQYDLVVIRSTWDYSVRRPEFLMWADSVPRFANPAASIPWNSDKHYLVELERAGIPVVPTTWMEPNQHLNGQRLHTRFPASGEFVIKPAVSGGAKDTGRYTANDAISRGLAITHALRVLSAGKAIMLQRYLSSVDELGESALIYFAGEFSHSVHKGAMLTGPDTGSDGLYQPERMSPREATDQEKEISEQVLAAAADCLGCAPTDFTYARVDLVSDDAGTPMLMELELIEPSLFTNLAAGSTEVFADAIVARLGRRP